MSVITKDLGVATAYGYAKSKGYTGTEEEFAELMASYADVAQQAEAAAQDAEDAKNAAITAKTAAQTAQTAAESAQTAAAGSAQTASTKATEASNSAQTAAGSATAAQTSATAASGSASTAQTAAQTATNKASEASSSASAASTAKTGAETARTGAQTAQAAAETAQANAEAAASSVSASAAQIEQNTEDIAGLKNDLNQLESAYSAFVVETETGAIASFSDGADDVPVKDLTVAIEPVQSGSGDPSPENVRPISGWTGANVTRVGGNLLNPVAKFAGFWAPAVGTHLGPLVNDYSSFSNDTITVMSPEWNGNGFASTPLVEGKQYKITGEINAVNPRCSFVMTDADMNVTRTLVNRVETGNVNTLFTVASGEKYVVISLINVSGNTGVTFKNPSVSESGVYEPYQGETYEVDWTTEAGTVYGGTLDVTTGVLTVTDKAVAIGSLTWQQEATYFFANTSDGNMASSSSETIHAKCSCYKSISQSEGSTSDYAIHGMANIPKRILIRDSSLNDSVSALVEQRETQTICYRLATPQTYQLTPQEVSTILGQNNIFADTGNVTVQYRADTKLYIDKVLNT